ncbi:uncharacterized protein LOC111084073 [Limulus polyphemus]|uniref:Uncharacterized protein LOC111084073 n=1 Tax=Limulus polyphemus TaxID=6850 RepID=A0ABM1RYW5_LIMPO|nr:uncharacterized protein LOC111084073 [Limulus polyphemus]XP_022236570.1 uncharacterized protein LOC111084073 [Limulus polyphemus]XP_022236571.1 uncharacterized protein LOC111084073 [Limulus polyphemus]
MAAVSEIFPVPYPMPQKQNIVKPNPRPLYFRSDTTLKRFVEECSKFPPEDSNQLQRLQEQVRAAWSQLAFLQAEHAKVLEGLHKEIDQLQSQCRELQLKLVVQESPAMCQVLHESKVEALESSVRQWQGKNKELAEELEVSLEHNDTLQQQLKIQESQYHRELAARDEVILNLQKELDLKCGTISYLSTQLQQLKEGSFFKRISLRKSYIPKCGSISKGEWMHPEAFSSSDKASSFKEEGSRMFPPIHTSSGKPKTSTYGSFTRRSSESSDSSFKDFLEDEQISIDKSRRGRISPYQSSLCFSSPKVIRNSTSTKSFDIKLPSITQSRHANRTLVRQQIKID